MLEKRDKQRLEISQIKILRHLLAFTKLDRERNQSVTERLGMQNTVLEVKTLSTKLAITL